MPHGSSKSRNTHTDATVNLVRRCAGRSASSSSATANSARRAVSGVVHADNYCTGWRMINVQITTDAASVVALAANLDDDGTVPVVFSGRREPFVEDFSLENYRGRIGQLHTRVDWGWSQVDEAMRCVVNHYQESGAADPAFRVERDTPPRATRVNCGSRHPSGRGSYHLRRHGFGSDFRDSVEDKLRIRRPARNPHSTGGPADVSADVTLP